MVSTWVSFHFIVVVQNHVYTITSYSRRSILNGQLVELNAKNDTSRPLTSGRLSSFFVSTLPLTEQAYSKMKKNNNKGVFLAILKKSFSEIQLGKYDVFLPRGTFPREAFVGSKWNNARNIIPKIIHNLCNLSSQTYILWKF